MYTPIHTYTYIPIHIHIYPHIHIHTHIYPHTHIFPPHTYNDRLSEEAGAVIANYYRHLRSQRHSWDASPVTTRQLEGLVSFFFFCVCVCTERTYTLRYIQLEWTCMKVYFSVSFFIYMCVCPYVFIFLIVMCTLVYECVCVHVRVCPYIHIY